MADDSAGERSSAPSAGTQGHAESEAPHGPREDGHHLSLVEALPTGESGAVSQSEMVDHAGDVVRAVDKRNGNGARAIRQRRKALSEPGVVEDAEGNVHRTKATSLVIPEEKRCKAMTVHGARCRVGKMRGLDVCIFHAHTALGDQALEGIAADPDEVRPRLSPRKALKARAALRADEMAEAAVDGAVSAAPRDGGRAILAVIDSVDPLVTEETTFTLSREGVDGASFKQLAAVYGS